MEINKKNIYKLLNDFSLIKIPFFQREYVWKKENVIKLIKDLKNTSQHNQYYLGSIIFKNQGQYKILIDGQQRITTILLIIKAISENPNIKQSDVKEKLASILNKFELKNFNVKKSNILKSILNDPNSLDKNDEDSNYYQNFLTIQNYFLSEIELDNFCENFLHNVFFSSVIFDSDVDENLVFSQINSTGKRLTSFDLFKNDLLSKISDNFSDSLQHEEREEKIEGFLKKIDFVNEYLDENGKNQLLRYFLSHNNKKLVNNNDIAIYKAYLKYYQDMQLQNNENVPEKIFNDYYEFAIYYKYFINKEYSQDEWKNEMLIIETQIGTYIPLLVDILKNNCYPLKKANIEIKNKESFKKCLSILEMFVVYRVFCKNDAKVLTRYIPTISFSIANLNCYPLEYFEKLYLILISYPQYLSKNDDFLEYSCPSKSDFEHAFKEHEIYKINKRFCKNLLIRFGTFNNKNNINYENFTIEHVMPQNMDKWKEDNFTDEMSDEELDKIKNTIGNLTLTPHNSDLSNEPFKKKKEIMRNKDSFCLNNYFLDKEQWNSKSINDRTNDLYHSKAAKIWNFDDIETKIEKIVNYNDLKKIISKNDLESNEEIKIINKNKKYILEYNVSYEKVDKMIKTCLTENKSFENVEKEILRKSFNGNFLSFVFYFINFPEKNKKSGIGKIYSNEEINLFYIKYKNKLDELENVINQIINEE